MSVRITKSDIDAMIQVVQELKLLKDLDDDPVIKQKYEFLIQRQRKVYLLLLGAAEFGQMSLQDLVTRGIADTCSLGNAVHALCPSVCN